MILYIILAIILVIILWNIFFSVKYKLQTINFFSGGLGSGKTLEGVKLAIKLRRRSILRYYLMGKHPIVFSICLFVILNIINLAVFKGNFATFIFFGINILVLVLLIKKRKSIKEKNVIREIYSNFPILIGFKKVKKGKKKVKVAVWSHVLTREHILGIQRLPEYAIVILDEASSVFPNRQTKSDVIVVESVRWFRHNTDGIWIMMDQSIGDIDIAIRRRINVVYNLSSFRKILFFFYKTDVNKLIHIEDMNMVNINDVNEFKTKTHFGMFGKRRYDSRYHKLFYKPTKEDLLYWTQFKINPLKEDYNKIEDATGNEEIIKLEVSNYD